MELPKEFKVYYNPDNEELSSLTPKVVSVANMTDPTIDDLVIAA